MVAYARRQPKRPPSERDQQIFYEVTVLGHLQVEVAQQRRLSQGRVSQIVGRVRRWRAVVSPREAGEPSAAQQARLSHWADLRLTEEISAAAMREFRRSERTLTTTRKGKRGTVEFNETTTREYRANGQFLNTALRAANTRSKLRAEVLPELPYDRKEKAWNELWFGLRSERQASEREKLVEPCNDVDALCDRLLGELYAVHPQREEPLKRSRVVLKRPPGARPSTYDGVPAKKATPAPAADAGVAEVGAGVAEVSTATGVAGAGAGVAGVCTQTPVAVREDSAATSRANYQPSAKDVNTATGDSASEIPPEVAAMMAANPELFARCEREYAEYLQNPARCLRKKYAHDISAPADKSIPAPAPAAWAAPARPGEADGRQRPADNSAALGRPRRISPREAEYQADQQARRNAYIAGLVPVVREW